MDNLVILCMAVVIALLSGYCIYGYISELSEKPKEEQLEALKYWLRKTVWEAEKYFGSKTGQLKLAHVYNLAVTQFPWIAEHISYEEFDKKYVGAALKWLEKIASNPSIKELME